MLEWVPLGCFDDVALDVVFLRRQARKNGGGRHTIMTLGAPLVMCVFSHYDWGSRFFCVDAVLLLAQR